MKLGLRMRHPRTYVSYDIYGNIGYGYSTTFYKTILDIMAKVDGDTCQATGFCKNSQLAQTGWTYVSSNTGTASETSGYLAEWMDHLAEEKFLNANGVSDADLFSIEGGISLRIAAMVRDGRHPNPGKIERTVADIFLNESGLNGSLFPFLIHFLDVNSTLLGEIPGQH